ERFGVAVPTGRVKWYDTEKGFGFLTRDDGGDVFVRKAALPAGVADLKPGQRVDFGIVESRRGDQALAVKLVDAPPSVAERRRRTQQGAGGADAFLAEILGELVDIQADVPRHHLGLYLLCVREHVLLARGRVRPGLPYRLADPSGRGHRVDRVPLGEDRAERDRQPGLALPPLAEVGRRDQPVPLVGEPGLVDDQPAVVPSVGDPGHD